LGGGTQPRARRHAQGQDLQAASDYFGTNIFIGASTMSKEEIRRRYVIGTDVSCGEPTIRTRGTWRTPRAAAGDFAAVPVDDTADMLGLTAAAVYGFDLDVLAPISQRIGPPRLLGQDASLRSDPERRHRPVVEGGVRPAPG